MSTRKLAPGKTVYDLLDDVEKMAVKRLMELHTEPEETIRRWIETGGTTADNHRRICAAMLDQLVASGLDPAVLGR